MCVCWVGGCQQERNGSKRLDGDTLSSALEGKVGQWMLDTFSAIKEAKRNVCMCVCGGGNRGYFMGLSGTAMKRS